MNKRITLKEATTFQHAEAMREIRNSSREFLTRNSNEISFEQQQDWWKGLDRSILKPYLAFLDDTPIGFGIVRFESSRWWLTGALLPQHRGKGYGEQLFKALIEEAKIPCWLEVKETNAPARALYAKLGFEPRSAQESINKTDQIIVMAKSK